MSDRIIYRAEQLGAGRAQLHRDVVIGGELVPELSHPVGSPAPLAAVARREREILLPSIEVGS
jgi:hypothetical protein